MSLANNFKCESAAEPHTGEQYSRRAADMTKSNKTTILESANTHHALRKFQGNVKLFSQSTEHGAQTSAWSQEPCQVSQSGSQTPTEHYLLISPEREI